MQPFTFGLFVADAKHCCLICDDECVSLYMPHLVFKRSFERTTVVQLDAFHVSTGTDMIPGWYFKESFEGTDAI